MPLNIKENISLSGYSTMRLGGPAKYLIKVSSQSELAEACDFAKAKNLNVIAIGQGSNIVWRDEGFNGLVIVNEIPGFSIKKDKGQYAVEIGAGEIWDKVVAKTVENDLSGIENLSLIPGTAGAAPVQNIGAYGAELSDVLAEIEAYDKNGQFKIISKEECGFGYRTSRFNTADKGNFIITKLKLNLHKQRQSPPFYRVLENYLHQHSIVDYSPANIRKAVIDIRSSKLPDPKIVANNGSFFKNPIVTKTKLDNLLKENPELPSWPVNEDTFKIPAGWLLERLNLKGYYDTETGMAIWDKQALVIVNKNAKTTQDLLKFKAKIITLVKNKYDVKLVQEPELI